MPHAKTIGLPLFSVLLSRGKVFREKPEPKVACLVVSIPEFRLYARIWREADLGKRIKNVIPDVAILTKPICLIMELTDAEGNILVNTGNGDFLSERAVVSHNAACLKRQSVPVEQRIEFIK